MLGGDRRVCRRRRPEMAEPRWLLLAYQLPTRPSNARVKTWRRLQELGAVPTRNSVYVLPNTEQCREDFEWMRSEIVALGGEATVFAADALNQNGDAEIEATFRRARDADYQELIRLSKDAAASVSGRRARKPHANSGDAAGERDTRINHLRE